MRRNEPDDHETVRGDDSVSVESLTHEPIEGERPADAVEYSAHEVGEPVGKIS